MATLDRNGVRLGQRVRDLDGNDLGKVTRLDDWGFEITKGFPILFHDDLVARYDEVRAIEDGGIVLARSNRDLQDLAAGELPPSWRVPAPPDYPDAATPAEASAAHPVPEDRDAAVPEDRDAEDRDAAPAAVPEDRDAVK